MNAAPSRTDDLSCLRGSGLFDETWYLDQYPDVVLLKMDPVEHYLWIGARLGRDPSRRFSTARYLQENRDVAQARLNPLLHYVRWGRDEGRAGALRPRTVPEARDEPEPDYNSSTFHAGHPYAFKSVAELERIGTAHRAASANAMAAGKGVAFFCAITGGYDALNFHEHLIPGADYVLFGDRTDSRYIYQPRRAPYHDEDPVRAARFVKTHAHMLLPGHRVAVWTDGNILIRDDLSDAIARFEASGLPVAAVPHPLRASVYEEAVACIKRGKDDQQTIKHQMQRYRREGFDCNDLIESNLMMFRIGHPALAPFLNTWWAEIERGSRRDQLSLNYAMRKTGIEWFRLTEKPGSVRDHPALALFHHRSVQPPGEPPALLPPATEQTYSDVINQRITAQHNRRVDVIVCVHNALDAVRACLESVRANRDPARHRIVIVNDGSDAPTSQWLADFAAATPHTHLIRHAAAGGYTRAANAGLRAMDADLAILLNSDTVVARHWIEKLCDASFAHPGVGIVGPLSSAASHQSIPDHQSRGDQTAINDMPEGWSVADMNAWCERQSPADFLPRVPLVHGFCFAVTDAAVKAIGLLDEESFPSGYGEENDYCLRAVNAGFSLAIAMHTYVFHEKSKSYQSDRRVALMKAGNLKIRELHGKERVLRAVRAMQANPHLVRLRQEAASLFPSPSAQGSPA